MKLSSLLNPNLFIFINSIGNFDELLDQISKKISKDYDIDPEIIKSAILERGLSEELILDNKVAIPHGRIKGINDTIICPVILQEPLLINNKEIKLFFTVITEKTSTKIYLKTLSTVISLSENQAIASELIKCKSGKDFIKIIEQNNITIKKELTVNDIMNKNVIPLSDDITLKDVIDIFAKNNLSYAPVVDKNNSLIGEININDIIKQGIPDYAEKVGNLSFLSDLEPFEALLKNEDKIYLKDILKQPSLVVTTEMSIIELAVELSKKGKRHAPVVNDKKLLGVVSLMDILMKIIREERWI